MSVSQTAAISEFISVMSLLLNLPVSQHFVQTFIAQIVKRLACLHFSGQDYIIELLL
jgi:hypothetical protein